MTVADFDRGGTRVHLRGAPLIGARPRRGAECRDVIEVDVRFPESARVGGDGADIDATERTVQPFEDLRGAGGSWSGPMMAAAAGQCRGRSVLLVSSATIRSVRISSISVES